MVTYNGVNHLAMATGDMDMTVRFWRDLLGMRLVAGHWPAVASPTPKGERSLYPGAGSEYFHGKK
jgi:catechol 2,3-dioxygenase-like lactoylglutathione lyase family enzyme